MAPKQRLPAWLTAAAALQGSLAERGAAPMRLSQTMSNHCLLAPIQECPADYFVKDVKLAVLGTGSVGKSGKRPRRRMKRRVANGEANRRKSRACFSAFVSRGVKGGGGGKEIIY